jgi:putative transposase
VNLIGEGVLLQQLTMQVLEAALEGELDAHLGYGKHERDGGEGNARNGNVRRRC